MAGELDSSDFAMLQPCEKLSAWRGAIFAWANGLGRSPPSLFAPFV